MSDILMTDNTRKLPPAGDLFQTPGPKDLYYLFTLFIQLLSQDQGLLFLLLHVILMAFDAISIELLGDIGEPARCIGKLTARMTAMAEGAGNTLPMNLILFP